jgi:hypothetical protein
METNMKWWPAFGLTRRFTEKEQYRTELTVESTERIFRKSLHIYPIDVGNANDLNLDIRAMQTPQYNIHRFGIFFADVPRHADVLLVLGRPTQKMMPALMETINQMPEPFLIVAVEKAGSEQLEKYFPGPTVEDLRLGNLAAHITDYKRPGDLISVLLQIMKKNN